MPLKGTIQVNEFYCKGCGLCVEACPQHVLQLSAERINSKGYHPAEISSENCIGCGTCAILCPEAAISVYRLIAEKGSA